MDLSRDEMNMLETMLFGSDETSIPARSPILINLVDLDLVRISEDGDYNKLALLTKKGRALLAAKQ
jgi:hypothetical protein